MIGEIGVVREKLAPRGSVFVHGEYWKAEADGEIDAGAKVEVIGVHRMVLRVRPAGQQGRSAG
jgi:membrane-bound serine protease (ClpP class)